ncbi:ferredoxin-type protein NapF [Motiliproteus sediminis]|uniref:ferredoxin-type protein NapF n=1 Tax=Motiliproteus sediminis TaxID=1468178 RepID=UPI001AEF49C0|nr:ferredoxin-type protein NapF [Motiliproteus sediminis]
MSVAFNPARRQLFRGDIAARKIPLRPPWSVNEPLFVDGCTRCDACLRACPGQIIRRDGAGFPELDFAAGECTFCGDCADACEEPLFRSTDAPPWGLKARISDQCVARRQVVCRSCGEQCEPQAIRFLPQLGQVAEPDIDLSACVGCGACIAVCPTQAVSLFQPDHEA